jgi:2-oxoglutarate dehydrogenase E2 component (dihydrolipoamide succinyltransferase)
MSTEVKVPAVGESITSGLLSIWHKKDGDAVAADEALFTLETDKVSTEVNAPTAGTLKIAVAEGEEVKIGQVVATIEPAEKVQGPKSKVQSPESRTEEPETEPAVAPKEKPARQAPKPEAKARKSRPEPAPPTVTPARGEAVTATLDLAKADSRTTRKKLTPLRRKIAAQLVNAQHTAAILTTFNECDMSGVMQLRKDMQEEFQKSHGVKLGFMSFFLKAAVEALKAVPSVNARMDGEELVQHHYYDIGVAVGTERGLIVPVLHDCDQKSFAEIERELIEYADKARDGKITVEDLQGGVFTISNGGIYGSLMSTPILNPPQSGILGMHKIQERAVALGGQVVIRPMMYLALSYDHRVVDGRQAVTFLVKVKDCIENPVRLLLRT